MSKLYMGFDAGTQSVKVAVYDEQFNCLTSHSLPTHLHYPRPGWVEMSADEFLEITVKSMAACAQSLREMGRDPKDVCAVMGDGIICGIVGVNAEGDAVTPTSTILTAAQHPTSRPSTPENSRSGAARRATPLPPRCSPRCSPAGS